MRNRTLAFFGACAVAMAGVSLMPVGVAGQVATAHAGGAPRTPDGHPDLQGTYDIATLTPLERPAGTSLVMTKEDAARLEAQDANRKERAALPSNGDRPAPPKGGDGSVGAAGNVGGYNNFWIDAGSEY